MSRVICNPSTPLGKGRQLDQAVNSTILGSTLSHTRKIAHVKFTLSPGKSDLFKKLPSDIRKAFLRLTERKVAPQPYTTLVNFSVKQFLHTQNRSPYLVLPHVQKAALEQDPLYKQCVEQKTDVDPSQQLTEQSISHLNVQAPSNLLCSSTTGYSVSKEAGYTESTGTDEELVTQENRVPSVTALAIEDPMMQQLTGQHTDREGEHCIPVIQASDSLAVGLEERSDSRSVDATAADPSQQLTEQSISHLNAQTPSNLLCSSTTGYSVSKEAGYTESTETDEELVTQENRVPSVTALAIEDPMMQQLTGQHTDREGEHCIPVIQASDSLAGGLEKRSDSRSVDATDAVNKTTESKGLIEKNAFLEMWATQKKIPSICSFNTWEFECMKATLDSECDDLKDEITGIGKTFMTIKGTTDKEQLVLEKNAREKETIQSTGNLGALAYVTNEAIGSAKRSRATVAQVESICKRLRTVHYDMQKLVWHSRNWLQDANKITIDLKHRPLKKELITSIQQGIDNLQLLQTYVEQVMPQFLHVAGQTQQVARSAEDAARELQSLYDTYKADQEARVRYVSSDR